MPASTFDDLGTFIDAALAAEEGYIIEGIDWNEELGALVEATAELIPEPPMLLFDNLKGYPQGYRVVSLPLGSARREALALGLPIDGCWSTPLDPLLSFEKRDSGDHTNSLAIFYAVRPFARRDTFPKVSRAPKELRRRVVEKYRSILPFPPA